jgi:general secretion pathway protein G
VLGIVALLLTLAVPRFFPSVDSQGDHPGREPAQRARGDRPVLHADTGRYPDSLEQLVEKKYLARLPLDPLTGVSDSGWVIVPPEDDPARRARSTTSTAAPGQLAATASPTPNGSNAARAAFRVAKAASPTSG